MAGRKPPQGSTFFVSSREEICIKQDVPVLSGSGALQSASVVTSPPIKKRRGRSYRTESRALGRDMSAEQVETVERITAPLPTELCPEVRIRDAVPVIIVSGSSGGLDPRDPGG
jgi:hypothetical protein